MIARFFRSDALIERLGSERETTFEAESFQLTYMHLRDPEGTIIARLESESSSLWRGPDGAVYSDVVIYQQP